MTKLGTLAWHQWWWHGYISDVGLLYIPSCVLNSGETLATTLAASGTREWKLPSEVLLDEKLVEAAGGSEVLAKLLIRRGIRTAAEARAFLDPSHYTPTGPMDLLGMPQAIVRITQAIARQEKITVYGDYDVDGVTATSVMLSTLRFLGANVDYYIPTRSEGYGLNLKAVSVLASKHQTKLLITCDCGISNFSEINFAKSLGVDSIVVDHHSMPELLPPAVAILHPKQLAEEHPFFHLPGVGVAYKLAEALLLDNQAEDEIPKLLDFVTLGMIADMVPLVQECRYLVQVGMPVLVNSARPGIKALLAQVGGREGTDLVGFGLAPRINAVGRLADANVAVQLMTTDDADEAQTLARKLESENLRRQELCEKIFQLADLKASQKLASGTDRALAIYDVGWHHGVIGIVASRLVEKYHVPVFIGELDEEAGIVKGSARGINGVDLYEVLKANEHLAIKWGGHKMAAGFSVESVKAEVFCQALVQTCNTVLASHSMKPELEIDLVIEPQEVTSDLARVVAKMAPFGMGNKKPILAMKKLMCKMTRVLGKENKHHRIIIADESVNQFECVFWNSRNRIPADGQTLDAAFTPEINYYNGTERLQLVLSDWRDPNARPAQPILSVVSSATADVTAVAPGASVIATAAGGPNNVVDMTPPGFPNHKDVAGSPVAPKPVTNTDNVVPMPTSRTMSRTVTWKDLREHNAPETLLEGAVKKFGEQVVLFAESSPRIGGFNFSDRTSVKKPTHLLIWQYPPTIHALKELVNGVQNIYLVGAAPLETEDATGFLKKVLGIVRFAVNQREGRAETDKMAAALGTSKMAMALGLAILRKVHMVDWLAEQGVINLEITGTTPAAPMESVEEFKQLSDCLRDISEFRRWCSKASFKEIQLALLPNAINVIGNGNPESQLSELTDGIEHHEQPSHVPTN
jgi:single-stranded-DNA-specific exonuclease